MKLTPRQQAFADYYIETGVVEESARRAGYSDKYARGRSYELLAHVGIKKYVEERMKSKEKSRIASQDEILEFLTSVVRGEITEQTPVTMKDSFEIVDKQPNVRDRTKAAELLGKRYAVFTDRLQADIQQAVTFVDDLDD